MEAFPPAAYFAIFPYCPVPTVHTNKSQNMITFTNNKHFGLVDIHQKMLEGNTAAGNVAILKLNHLCHP
jgi:hypothetical protein